MNYSPGEMIFSKYRIEREIGRGKYGCVYLVTHTGLKARRALKVIYRDTPGLSPGEFNNVESRLSFCVEMGARINNPYITHIYDVESYKQALCLIMEYCPGGSLEDKLEKAHHEGKFFEVNDALRIGLDIARGLECLHEQKLILRDLRPSNVLLDDRGRAKIADLGSAQFLDRLSSREDASAFNPDTDTSACRSPELCENTEHLSLSSDIYSLGVIMLKMLTLRDLDTATPDSLLNKLRPGVPKELKKLLGQMLAEDPKQRPPDGHEVAENLRHIITERAKNKKSPAITLRHRILCPYCLQKVPNDEKCSLCRASLPILYRENASKQEPMILSTVGFSGHGKTVFLSALFYELRHKVTDIWPRFFSQGLDMASIDTLKGDLLLLERGELPEATRRMFPRPSLHQLTDIPTYGNQLLIAYDPPGEAFNDDVGVANYAPFAKNSKSVLFLISPTDLESTALNHMELLLDTYLLGLNRLQSRTEDQNLIVVYTKADLWIDQLQGHSATLDHLVHSDIKELSNITDYQEQLRIISDELTDFTFSNLNGRNFITKSTRYFRSVSYCAISALGVAPREGRLPVKVEPRCVLDPLLWVLYHQRRFNLVQRLLASTTELLHPSSEYSHTTGKKLVSFYSDLDDVRPACLIQDDKQSLQRTGRTKIVFRFLQSLQGMLTVGEIGEDIEQDDLFTFCTWRLGSFLGNSNLPDKSLLVLLNAQVFDQKCFEKLKNLIRKKSDYGDITIIILIAEQNKDLTQVESLLNKFRQTYAYNLVILSPDTLASIVSSRDPGHKLRNHILSEIDISVITPYVTTGPVPEHAFFGREYEIKLITERINQTSFALTGGRRVGKTSILLKLHRFRLPDKGLYSIYCDLSSIQSSETVWDTKIDDWQPDRPTHTQISTFDDLRQIPSGQKPLILLLDEADNIIAFDRDAKWQFFSTLRSLVAQGKIQVVFSGEQTLRDTFGDPTSPLYNFVTEVLLGPLDARATEELIVMPMQKLGIQFFNERVVVKKIYDFTLGHANVVQRLCNRLVTNLSHANARVLDAQTVDVVINDPVFLRDDFLETYWESASPLEKIITLIMSDNTGIHSIADVRQALMDTCGLTSKASEVDDALQRLVDLRSILKRTKTGYCFSIEDFPKVVHEVTTIRDMLPIFIEEYVDAKVS